MIAARISAWAGLLTALPAALPAAERHVSPDGSDDAGGTAEAPWATVQHAADSAQPGDVVHIGAGVYRENVSFTVSGEEKAGPIVFRGEKGAVISGGQEVKEEYLFELANVTRIHIESIEFRSHSHRGESAGVRVEGHSSHIEIRNCLFHDLRGKNAMAICVYGTDPAKALTHLVIEGNTIHDCEPAPSEALTLNGNIDGFRVARNIIRDVNNIGIDFIGGEKDVCPDPTRVCRNGLCEENRVERARSSYGGGWAAGIYVDGGRDITLRRNIVTGCDLGIEIGAENHGQTVTGIRVLENDIHSNDKAGIALGGYKKSAGRVSNCVFSGNRCYENARHPDAMAELWIQGADTNTIAGNTFHAGRSDRVLRIETLAGPNTLKQNTFFTLRRSDDSFVGGRRLSGPTLDSIADRLTALPAPWTIQANAANDPKWPDPEKGRFDSPAPRAR